MHPTRGRSLGDLVSCAIVLAVQDQYGMTAERLRAQLAEDWFDPDGFRLHERWCYAQADGAWSKRMLYP